jgi:hypothetical protein
MAVTGLGAKHHGVPRILGTVPLKNRTVELCDMAILKDIYAFDYVPTNIKKAVILKYISLAGPNILVTLGAFPSRYLDEEVCNAAFKVQPRSLLDFPDKHITEEKCIEAINQISDPYIFSKLKLKFKTEAVCLAFIKNNVDSLYMIPGNRRTAKVCLAALKFDHENYEHVPTKLIHKPGFLAAAVKENLWVIRMVPENLRKDDVAMAVVDRYPAALKQIPEGYRTAKVCLQALISAHEDAYSDPNPEEIRGFILYKVMSLIPNDIRDTVVKLFEQYKNKTK